MANRLEWFNKTTKKQVVEQMVHAIKHAGDEKCHKKTGCKFTPGVQPEYFRAFDSGDFQGIRDVEIWTDVAKQLPETKFWFPTTAYGGLCHSTPAETTKFLGSLRRLNALPNVVVRPSARGIDTPAAVIKGLGPGSAVIEKATATAGAKRYREELVKSHGGKETGSERLITLCDEDSKSCQKHYVCPGNCALCRKCWKKDMPVVYKRHGLKPRAENIQRLVRKVTGLEEHGKSNKSAVFAAANEKIQENFGKLFNQMFDGPVPPELTWKRIVKHATPIAPEKAPKGKAEED